MVYVFLADGFEDIEALGTVDILRRCGLEVKTLSISGKRVVVSAHDITVKADSFFRKNHLIHCDAIVLPGGGQGAELLAENTVLRLAIQQQHFQKKIIAAICAAPKVLAQAGILSGRHVTMYPGMEECLPDDCTYHDDAFVVEDGNVITGCGPGATHLFALTIANRLTNGSGIANQVALGMCYTSLDKARTGVLRF